MKKVFISCSLESDEELLRELKQGLEKRGIEGIDVSDLSQGRFSSEVTSAIQGSDAIIAIVGKDRPNVMFELGYALGADKSILLIAGPEESLPKYALSLPYVLRKGDVRAVVTEVFRRISDIVTVSPTKEKYASVDDKLKTYFTDPDYFKSIDPLTFEQLLTDWFRQKGFFVERQDQPLDLGYDFAIRSTKDGNLILVQAKKLNRQSLISVQDIQNLLSATSVLGATIGILVATTGFTSAALALAATSEPKLLLLSFEELLSSRQPRDLIEAAKHDRLFRVSAEAEEIVSRTPEIDKGLGRLEGMANQYRSLGIIYRIRGDLDKAEDMHRKSLEINERLGRLEGMADQYNNLGVIWKIRGDLDKAEDMYRKSLEINERLGRLEGMAIAYGNLGNVYKIRNDLDKAEEMHKKSLEINERLGRLEGMANAYGNLASIYGIRNDLDKAEQMTRNSLDIDERLGRLEGMAIAYGNLGIIYKKRGDLDKAEDMHRKSLEINKHLGKLEGIANAYGNLGNVYQIRGDLDKAEEMHRKSLDIEERMGRLEGMANDYGNLGDVYKIRGDLDRAEEMYRKSLQLFQQIGSGEAEQIKQSLIKLRGEK